MKTFGLTILSPQMICGCAPSARNLFPKNPVLLIVPRTATLVLLGIAQIAISVVRAQTPLISARALDNRHVELSWPATALTFSLEQSPRVGTGAAWTAVSAPATTNQNQRFVTVETGSAQQFFRLRTSAGTPLVRLVQTSPATGEANVSVQRETVLEFSEPLSSGTVLSEAMFSAQAAGRNLLTRRELSFDRRRATLFYLEPVPSGAHIVVRLNGDALTDSQGRALDADNDGRPGGTALIEYDTMITAALPGTGVSGFVYASDPVLNNGAFTNRPLAGVLITVDGAEDRLRTETDQNGHFVLSPSPVGTFFVHIDGRPALGSDWPTGAYYPVVGKTFDAVAGTTNTRPTGVSEIYLPWIGPGTLQAVSATRETVVSFPAAVIANNPALAGVSLTVPPNSLFDDNGTRGGRVGLAPVPPDRIPSPLPPGLNLPLVITVQTDGPSNFDQPVPVRFPNLPDPKTGVKLPPGAKSALWSFNHDTGRWEIRGSMTVTADGNFVESDPGVGIRQPGWHGSSPGSTGQGGGGNSGPCSTEQKALEDALLGCAIGAALELAELAPAIGCGVSLASALASTINACGDPQNNCAASAAYNGFFGVAGCIPGVGTYTGILQCSIELGSALGDLAACQSINAAASGLRRLQLQTAVQTTDDAMAFQDRLSGAAATVLVSVLGDSRWMEASARDSSNMVAFANAFTASLAPNSESGSRISAGERTALLGLPSPNNLPNEVRNALLDRFDRFAQGGITPAEQQTITEAANQLGALSAQAQSMGWETMLDGFKQTWTSVVSEFDTAAGGGYSDSFAQPQGLGVSAATPLSRFIGPPHERQLLYRLIDQSTGFTRYGKTESTGELNQLILGVDQEYILTYLDPTTLEVGSVYFRSGTAGGQFTLPRARLAPVSGPDTDGDGLVDLVESVVGTDPASPDTDHDGTTDLVEVQQGLNPLDGLALPQGVSATLPLGSRALGIHVDGSRAYIANGQAGLSIVDVTDPLRPVLAGQLDLLGESFDVAFAPEHQMVGLLASPEQVLPGERGLIHFVDVSAASAPRLVQSYSMPASSIDSWNGYFYVAIGQFAAKEVRIYDGKTGLEVGWFATQDYPTGLRVAGGRAYVATSSGLEIFDITLAKPIRLGRLAGEFTAELLGRVHLVLDGSTLFVSKTKGPITIDVSDPAVPKVLGPSVVNAPAVRSLALNGGGQMLALTMGTPEGAPQGRAVVSLYDVSDPTKLGVFQFSLTSLGAARDVAYLNGFALVADDLAGLTILNFASPDLNRRPPTIAFSPASLDRDLSKAGVQVAEGSRVQITPVVRDDVQVDRVELIVAGQPVAIQRTYPVAFWLDVPTLAENNNQTSFTFQIRATDRSGNVTLGDPIVLELVRDTAGPALFTAMPTANGAAYIGKPLVLRFNNPIQTTVDLSKVTLLYLGQDAVPGGGDDSPISANVTADQTGVVLEITAAPRSGAFRLTLLSGALRDLAGDPIAEDMVLDFVVVDASPGAAIWISDQDGNFDDAANWLQGRLPLQEDAVLQRFSKKPTVTLGNGIVRNINIGLPIKTGNRASLTVLGNLQASETVDLATGSFVFQKSAAFAKDLSIAGAEVEAAARLEVQGKLTLARGGVLTLTGTDAQLSLGGPLDATNCGIGVTEGAILNLPQLVNLDAPGDFDAFFPAGATLFARGTGSKLTLPELVSASGPTNWNVRGAPSLQFNAEGGTLEFPKLRTASGRFNFAANGFGGVISAPKLETLTGSAAPFPAAMEVASGCTLEFPALVDIVNCDATLATPGILRGTRLHFDSSSSLQGDGTVAGTVALDGKLILNGFDPLTIQGDLTLGPSATVEATIGLGLDQTFNGKVGVQGGTTLAGTLQIVLARGYVPKSDAQFELATFAHPSTGAFNIVDDTSLGSTLKGVPTVEPTRLLLNIAPR